MCVIARSGDIAEKIRFPFSAGSIKRRRFGTQLHEYCGKRFFDRSLRFGKTIAADVPEAGLLQVGQLLEELFKPKRPLQGAEKFIEARFEASCFLQCAAKQRKARIDAS